MGAGGGAAGASGFRFAGIVRAEVGRGGGAEQRGGALGPQH